MSADSWARCPYCIQEARKTHERDLQELADAYGVVTPDVYQQMHYRIPKEFDPWSVDPTLREDWEIGFGGDASEDPSSGILVYSANCRSCGASIKIDTTISLGAPA